MGLGHILPMGIQNNWGDEMVVENHQIQPSLSYFDNFKPSSGDYNRCIPNSVGINIPNSGTKCKDKQKKRNKKIISRREKGNLTSLMTFKWSYTDQIGLNKNLKLKKNYQIVQQKWSNWMKKQT
jgi:hypothetical protein